MAIHNHINKVEIEEVPWTRARRASMYHYSWSLTLPAHFVRFFVVKWRSLDFHLWNGKLSSVLSNVVN
jgi:hypothetical protein